MNLPIFERLGVLDRVRTMGVPKYGAEFCPGDHDRAPETIYFSDAIDKEHPLAYQVRRSEFDELLFRNAVARGVEAHEGVRVKDVSFRAGAGAGHLVRAVDDAGAVRNWETRFVVDASGRDTLLSRKFDLKEKNLHHQSAAIFGHFTGVQRRAGRDGGNISIYWFEHGWFWMIPLRDGVTSVGAVCWPEYLKTRTCSPDEFLWRTIGLCPRVSARMQSATLVDKARATGNYSYTSKRMYGDGYILVGDAFAFIDPVFSTGVLLAMSGATFGADAVDACLRDPASAPPLLRRFERKMRQGIATVSWFIYRFTSPAMQELFMAPRNVLHIQEAIISVLAGDLFRSTPLTVPLAVFKAVFYLTFAKQLPRAWRSHRRRRISAGVRFEGGTLPEDRLAGRFGGALSIAASLQNSSADGGQTALSISYERPDPALAQEDRYVLARIGFGERAVCEGPDRLTLPLLPIGGEPLVEIWRCDRPVKAERAGDLYLHCTDDIVFGVVPPQADADIETATFQTYERIFETLSALGTVRLIRVWNFFSRIHERFDGFQRYGLFCRGRHRALARHLSDFEPSLPAASAIGTPAPGLCVCFLACRNSGVQIENPRQVSAFHYPSAYAPKSPSFSRSILRNEAGGRYRLYVSGTAAIVGHVSRHPGDLTRQLDESCENLEALLASASDRAGTALAYRLLRVYLRETADTTPFRAMLRRRFGNDVPLLFLRGDICRRDLLVEIEGIAESESRAAFRTSS